MKQKISPKDISLIAMITAIICICSWISIPVVVPFTMQTFGIFVALLILGGKKGTVAIALYILLGIVGVPVFSGFQGSIGHVLGPLGGYIVGFIFIGIIYLLGENHLGNKGRVCLLAIGLFICYLVGTLWFITVSGDKTSFWTAITICVLPYVIPDIIKLFLAFIVSRKIKKAIGL